MNERTSKLVIKVAGVVLVTINTIGLLAGIIGLYALRFTSPEEMVVRLNIHTRFPQLLYYGAFSGLITSPIYIAAGIGLLRMRENARQFLLWYIPAMVFVDTIYLFMVNAFSWQTSIALIVDVIILAILFNKKIEIRFVRS